MFEEAVSLLSLWASMNSWLTPTVLFLLLNLMIGTIALTSGFTSSKPHHHHHYNHHDTAVHHHQQPQLTRAPSVLQRLKSINIYSYYSHTPSTTHVHVQQQNSSPASDLPVEPETVAAPILVQPPPFQVHDQVSLPKEEEDDDEGPTLDEIYSRIKGTSSSLQYGRQNSDTKPTGGEIPVKLPAKMKKSASHKSAFNHFHPVDETEDVMAAVMEERENVVALPPKAIKAVVGGDDEVDAKADDFINKFRQQLKLQRIESFVRYKDMITRGSGK